MDCESIFDKVQDQNAFVKTTTKPSIDGAQKTALNRKGNILYNSGDIEGARRIFQTTGYSDGLTRVGDHYYARGRHLDALKMYWIAPNRQKAEPIILRLSNVIQSLLHEEGERANE